jgi:hypothetical protein
MIIAAGALTPITAAAQTPLICGQVVSDSIVGPADLDQFTFFAEQGDIVTITLVQTGAIDPGFFVFGHLLAPGVSSPGPIGGGIRNVPLTRSGIYTVRVFDLNNTRRGTYSLRLAWLLPLNKRCGNQTELACGQIVNGTIAAPLQQDQFTFFGQQGSTATITLTSTGAIDPGFFVFGHLFTPTGIGPGPIGGGILNVPLTQTGTYTIRIFDLNNTRRGHYTLRLGFVGPCPAPPPAQVPSAPTNLTAAVSGGNVTLTWAAGIGGGQAASFVIEAGSASGASNLLTFDTGASSTSFAAAAPPGTYFVRVRARNASGTSGPSNEAIVLVGVGSTPCVAAPSAPANLVAAVAGQQVTIQWIAAGGPVTTYIIEAGSFAGAANIAIFATGSANTSLMAVAAPGTYFVRVRARNDCGTSEASNEVTISVF